jgi:F420-dependent oxidoreductase-like protein
VRRLPELGLDRGDAGGRVHVAVRVGLFIGDATGARTTVDDLVAAARAAEAAGFATGWVPHIPWSLDGLTALALAGQVTERIELGTAVMPTYTRHPLAMAQQALSAHAASGGRVALGVGPSHPVVIEKMFGLEYDRPAAHTREYVEVLRRAVDASVAHGQPDGEFVAFDGEFFHVSAMLVVPGADTPMPILVAALAPLMLRLAGEATDGTITYWANERAVGEHVVPRITRAAEAADRAAPRVVVGVPVAVVRDPVLARERAAQLFSTYETIPTYQRILGRSDAGPADVAVIGTEEEVLARLRSFAAAGATDLCAAPLGLDDDREKSARRTVELLASAAGGL